jgi:hypothetical protein
MAAAGERVHRHRRRADVGRFVRSMRLHATDSYVRGPDKRTARDVGGDDERWFRSAPGAEEIKDGCVDGADIDYDLPPEGINFLPTDDSIGTIIKPGYTIALLGASGSGKSVMGLDLLLRLRKYHTYGIAVCPTKEGQEKLARIMPSCLVLKRLTLEIFERFVEFGRQLVDQYGEDDAPMGFLFADDVGFCRDVFRSTLMEEVVSNGRHFAQTYIWCAQNKTTLPPVVREQAPFVFVFRCRSSQAQRFYYDTYFTAVPKERFFGDSKRGIRGLFEEATGRRRALVSVRCEDGDMSKQVYVHMVRDIDFVKGSHVTCHPRLWWLNDLFYVSREGEARVRHEQAMMDRRIGWARAIASTPAAAAIVGR